MITKEQRNIIYGKFDGRCAYCGKEIEYSDMQVDHIIPKSRFINIIRTKYHIPKFLEHLGEFDLNHMDNLFPSCRVCNKWKSTYTLGEFRFELSEQVRRLNVNNANYRIAKMYGLVCETNNDVVFYFEKN